MTTTTRTRRESARASIANGIRTNYLRGRLRRADVVLVHGSGPGVTAYANWRLVLPALGENFTCSPPTWSASATRTVPRTSSTACRPGPTRPSAFMDAMGIEKAHLVGNSFGGSIALRIATQHPDRVDKLVLMGSMGVHFEITEGLDKVWGYEGTDRGHAQGAGLLRLLAGAGQRGTGPGPVQGQHGTRLPGVVLVDVPGPAAALGRRHDHPRGGDPQADRTAR